MQSMREIGRTQMLTGTRSRIRGDSERLVSAAKANTIQYKYGVSIRKVASSEDAGQKEKPRAIVLGQMSHLIIAAVSQFSNTRVARPHTDEDELVSTSTVYNSSCCSVRRTLSPCRWSLLIQYVCVQ